MKKFLSLFLILIVAYSFTNAKSLNKENSLITEKEKLEKKSLPTYSTTPFQLLMDQSIHGQMNFPSKMFYTRLSLSDQVSKLPDTYALTDDSLQTSKFFETSVFLPYQMAKLDVEYTFNHGIVSTSDKVSYTLELYIGNVKIAEEFHIARKIQYTNTIHLGGSIFNVPAGTHQIYLKVTPNRNKSSNLGLKLSSTLSSKYYSSSTIAHVEVEKGNIDIVGYPLES